MNKEIRTRRNFRVIGTVAVMLITMLAFVGCGDKSTADKSEVKEPTKVEQTVETKEVSADTDYETKVEDASSEEKASYNNSSNNDTSSAKPSNSGKPSGNTNKSKDTSAKETHTHNWVAVYSTGYKTETYTENEAYQQCTNCGADVTGFASSHAKEHALAGEGCGHRTAYRTVTKTREVPYEYVSGYKCSCGATK